MLIASQSFYERHSVLEYITNQNNKNYYWISNEEIQQQCREMEITYKETASDIALYLFNKAKLKDKIILWVYYKIRARLIKKI